MKKFTIAAIAMAMIIAMAPAGFAGEPASADVAQAAALSADAISADAEAASEEAVPERPLNPSEMTAGTEETYESLFVTVDWLKKNLKKAIIIDARPESLYVGGHIPGAVSATWTYFAKVNTRNGTRKWGVLWPEATMAKRIGALGINNKKPVVVYCDGGGWGQSGYVAMVMRASGVKNVKILDGGILAWKHSGGKMSRNKHKNKAVGFSLKKYKPEYIVDTDWLNDNIGKENFVVLDVRTPQEYAGKIRPFQERRAGHIPTAINLPMSELTNKEFAFKSREELTEIFRNAGLTPESEIVVYDTAGVRAGNVLMVLRYTGFLKSRCYDEGYQAWAGEPELPIELP
jgi:3-mercaptopyruvate sulfurtransferase SseA